MKFSSAAIFVIMLISSASALSFDGGPSNPGEQAVMNVMSSKSGFTVFALRASAYEASDVCGLRPHAWGMMAGSAATRELDKQVTAAIAPFPDKAALRAYYANTSRLIMTGLISKWAKEGIGCQKAKDFLATNDALYVSANTIAP